MNLRKTGHQFSEKRSSVANSFIPKEERDYVCACTKDISSLLVAKCLCWVLVNRFFGYSALNFCSDLLQRVVKQRLFFIS